jgi:hypothetical protein
MIILHSNPLMFVKHSQLMMLNPILVKNQIMNSVRIPMMQLMLLILFVLVAPALVKMLLQQ